MKIFPKSPTERQKGLAKVNKSLSRVNQVVVTGLLLSTLAISAGSVQAKVQNSNQSGTPNAVSEEVIDGKSFNVTHTIVRAQPEKVWQVLTDYDNATKVFSQLRKCTMIQDKGSTKIVKHTLVPSGTCLPFEYTLEIKEQAPKALEWHRVSGAFREVDGYWHLEPMDNGHATYVTYASYVNGGILIPQGLIKRQFKMDMPDVLVALKNQAEGSSTRIARRPDQPRDQ